MIPYIFLGFPINGRPHLEGTMTRSDGLITGARRFFQWLEATGKPYVFLSNRGAPGSFLNMSYAQMQIVVKIFRANSKILTSKFWFSLAAISKILV